MSHAAVFVGDLERTRRFYETYFGGTASILYRNAQTGGDKLVDLFVGNLLAAHSMPQPAFETTPSMRPKWANAA